MDFLRSRSGRVRCNRYQRGYLYPCGWSGQRSTRFNSHVIEQIIRGLC